ncbi:MAG: outer membrane beta-barrel protein [Verrucomicrobiota bacterium]
MKINKWTLGLAAVGLVSLSSVAQAEETSVPLMTALSSTVISGYVDASAVWNPGTGNANPAPVSFNAGKQDGFNLNVVNLTLEKPLDEGTWSAGYKVELLFGPDAVGYNPSANSGTFIPGTAGTPASNGPGLDGLPNTADDVVNPATAGTPSRTTGNQSDFGIKQAYIALRAPVGNGLDLKLGVFDTPIGYESFVGYRNPNYTRSYGYTIEPTQHTGVLASYQFSDIIGVSAGIANTLSPGINSRSPRGESSKAYMGSITLTAPQSMGALAGSALYAGIVDGFAGNPSDDQTSYYLGATIATPVAGLRFGAAYDHASNLGAGGYASAIALYASFQASEKVSFHARAEYAKLGGDKITALTGTVQYDLWQNVISRLEIRWDHSQNSNFGGTSAGPRDQDPLSSTFNPNGAHKKNEVMIAANLVYKF